MSALFFVVVVLSRASIRVWASTNVFHVCKKKIGLETVANHMHTWSVFSTMQKRKKNENKTKAGL